MPVLDTLSSILPTWDLWVIKDVVGGGCRQHPNSFLIRQADALNLFSASTFFQLWPWDVHCIKGLRQSLGRGDRNRVDGRNLPPYCAYSSTPTSDS